MHNVTSQPPNTAMIKRYEGQINPSDFQNSNLWIFFLPLSFFKIPFLTQEFEKKKLNPDTNSNNLQATTNTVAPLLTFYKNFILKIQALSFKLYNRFTSPASLQNYSESAYHLRRPKPWFSYSL